MALVETDAPTFNALPNIDAPMVGAAAWLFGHSACALAQAPAQALALDTPPQKVTGTAKRGRRVSKGATNLPLEIKDTPLSIIYGEPRTTSISLEYRL